MQMLYAVDFDVTGVGATDPQRTYTTLLDHVHHWLAWGSTNCPGLADFEVPGEAEYRKTSIDSKPESLRKTSWKLTGAGADHAFRIDVRQPLLAEGTWFQTRVTVSRNEETARLRVVMGRDITTGWLSPAPFDILRRPRLILDVTRNDQLMVRVLGQRVDDRYIAIREPAELDSLVEAVRNTTRLPILVTSPANHDGREFARQCARELQGLARVATLRPHLSILFNQNFLENQVPFGGARLYWPDLSLRQPYFSSADQERNGPTYSLQQILHLLAPISVIARGRDVGWESAAAAERAERAAQSQQRLDDARATGDHIEQIQILTETLGQRQTELAEWEQLNEVLMVEKEQLQGQLQLLEDLRHQSEHWKSEYFRIARGQGSQATNSWSDAPLCSKDDIEPLLHFAQEVSGGSFHFTRNAARSWQRSGYPFPDAMREAVINLAQASVAYREAHSDVGRRLEEWAEDKFALKIAMSDKGLVRAGLDRFEHDGQFYSRIPHVKLDDHTSPDRVGRIYFGVDREELRFIVDHIGLKLYGL